jgi:cobyrinic acid a,c-diamide synthase
MMFSAYKMTSQINVILILIIDVSNVTGSVCSTILGYVRVLRHHTFILRAISLRYQ